MNILPKKSWHVRTKANIERVRKDEAQAAEEEKERLRKIALAEQESRTDFLRSKAKKRRIDQGNDEESPKDVVVHKSGGHLNFFEEVEDGKGFGTNKAHEEEKQAEKEKQEKAIGLLTYLGQSAVEAQTDKPWYFKPPKKQTKSEEAEKQRKEENELKRKDYLDPMHKMVEYVKKKKHKHKEKDKKHKHKRKEKERTQSAKSGSKTNEQLRSERLKREQKERMKTEQLMAKLDGDKPEEPKEYTLDDERQGRYNNQFNPDFVRVRKKQQRDHY